MKEITVFFFCLGILAFIYLLLLLTIDTLKKIVKKETTKKNNTRETERKIYEWEVSDEYGWRMVELWEIGERLELFATDQDGGFVEPRV